MKFKEPLIKAKFVSRPNRFITVIEVNGEEHRSHLADPGRLKELLFPGVELLVRKIKNIQKRKTKYSTIMVRFKGQLISLVSTLPNQFVKDELIKQRLPFFQKFNLVRPEVAIGKHRFDFLLKDEEGEDFVLEVKSVTLVKNKIAMFPDAVTLRGKNHLQALKELVKKNQKTGVLFVCQRPDATSFQPMWQRDDKFCYALLEAHKFGVKIWCITLSISENGIKYNKEIPIYLDQNK